MNINTFWVRPGKIIQITFPIIQGGGDGVFRMRFKLLERKWRNLLFLTGVCVSVMLSVCKCNGMCDIVTHYTSNTLVSDGASSYWVQKFCVRYLMFTKLHPRDQVSNQNVIYQAYKLKSFSVVMIINTDWFLVALISALALNHFPYLFSVFQDLATHQ